MKGYLELVGYFKSRNIVILGKGRKVFLSNDADEYPMSFSLSE